MKDQSTDFFSRLGQLFAVRNKRHAQIVAGIIAVALLILFILTFYQ